MLRTVLERFRQGHRTARYPKASPVLPDRLFGRHGLDPSLCDATCARCAEVCPTGAVVREPQGPAIDLGRCLFCGACVRACPSGALTRTCEHRLAARAREDLMVRGGAKEPPVSALAAELCRLFGRSLQLRQVSAGGCNACEADINVLGTPAFDLGRFGIKLVASPRHADGLIVTGPVSANMELALKKTYQAVPDPKIVIAVGACAIFGGPFEGHEEVATRGVASVLPVDLFIPGCPPHPYTILDGLLRLLRKI